MVFKKMSINGKSYGDCYDDYENPIEITEVFTRGIWKVLSMVFYLSIRFTNPIMCGIILKNYLSSMLWHIFHKDIIMQTRIISL